MSYCVLRAVFFEDRGWWVAQCLEYNLTASSKDPRELRQKLERVVKVQIEADLESGRTPFSSLPPAPGRFWTLFENAEPWVEDQAVASPPTGFPVRAELAFA